MRFTPAQQQAIDATNPELLVSAAAGSGKTAVLVERIVQMIIRRGYSIDRMLIVTFTRAAAGEMRERLENRLTDLGETDPRLARQADLVPMAQISTIHSFCQQAVRQNFQHCSIDPQFGLCDERTRQTMYDECLNDTLDQLYTLAKTDPDIASLTAKFTEKNIVEMLGSLYRFLLSRPDPMEWLDRHANHQWTLATLDQEPMAQSFCQEAALMTDAMQALWKQAEALSQRPAFPAPYLKTLSADLITLQDLSASCQKGMRALIDGVNQCKFARLATARPDTQDEAELAEAFKELRNRYKGLVDELKKLLPADCAASLSDMAIMAPAVHGLQKAVHLFHDRFTGEKREQGMIDFNDLEHMTLDILRQPYLRQQLAGRFDAVFVDEYQDVSELQEAILNALKRHDGTQSYFYVGDVKQSIYRFRLAEPGLFLGKLNHFSPQEDAPCRKIILNRNFRSKTTVLNSVNRVFAHVMDRRVMEIDYDADAMLYPGVPSTGDPATQVHVLNTENLRSQDTVLAEAELIARDILSTIDTPVVDAQGQVAGRLQYSDIAVLLPAAKNVADKVEATFRRLGIPVYCEGVGDTFHSEEVTQLIQYLSLMDNLMNDLALISVLRSPLFHFTEQMLAAVRLIKPERKASYLSALQFAAETGDESLRASCRDVLDTLERERFYLRSMPLADYLWDFLNRSGLYLYYGAQPGGKARQANLQLICHRASDWDRNHTDGLHGFVQSLIQSQQTGDDASPAIVNPWENVVRIMTIHKSKGLEFPTVYVMGLGGSLLKRAASRDISMHGDVGFSLSYVNEQARTRRMTLLQGAIALRERNAERAERARVLYVAMTRAKNRLVLVGGMSGITQEGLCKSAASGSDIYAARSAKSMLDWILQSLTPQDSVQELSTDCPWKTDLTQQLPTVSTSFPHKSALFQVFIHIDPAVTKQTAQNKPMPVPQLPTLPQGTRLDNGLHRLPNQRADDPFLGSMDWPHHPFKTGVTALCRALETGQAPESEEETAEVKRYPLLQQKPRLLEDMPKAPAFLLPPKEEIALETGVQTHRLLGLIDLDGARQAVDDPKALYAYVCREVERLTAFGSILPKDAPRCDRAMAARFLESDLGRRMLQSPTVHREWSFNLMVDTPFHTLLQGVIDLCFIEDGAWVLADYKTDRVSSAADLWPRYHRQLEYYAQALTAGTGLPVREKALFSLRLGESFAKFD